MQSSFNTTVIFRSPLLPIYLLGLRNQPSWLLDRTGNSMPATHKVRYKGSALSRTHYLKVKSVNLPLTIAIQLSSTRSTVAPGRFILGLAFDPMDTVPNPPVYFSSSKMFHKGEKNSGGLAINGAIHRVSGGNLDSVENVITGLPVSDHGTLTVKTVCGF